MNHLHLLVKSSLASLSLYSLYPNNYSSPEGSVFSWGLNTSGQLGLGSHTAQGFPKHIEELSAASVHSSAHCRSSAVLSPAGDISTWGYGMDGILGHEGTDSNILVPTLIEGLRVAKLQCGGGHMAALTAQGTVLTWGLDDAGQCGQQVTSEVKNSKFYSPSVFKGGRGVGAVTGLEDKTVVDVGCGKYFTAAVTSEGELFTWGAGRDFALGHGDRLSVSVPKRVESLEQAFIVKVACGRNFIVALDRSGDLYSWGNNDNGQLGISQTEKYREKPTKVRVLKNVVDIQSGDFHVFALDKEGAVYSWGAGTEGQLGHGNTANQSTPKHVQGLPQVAAVSCGGGHTALVTTDFTLLVMGRGRDGQLGRQGKIESVANYRTSAVTVDFFAQWRILSVACGSNHTLALAVRK